MNTEQLIISAEHLKELFALAKNAIHGVPYGHVETILKKVSMSLKRIEDPEHPDPAQKDKESSKPEGEA